jgi:hypothetical protein
MCLSLLTCIYRYRTDPGNCRNENEKTAKIYSFSLLGKTVRIRIRTTGYRYLLTLTGSLDLSVMMALPA